MKAPFTIGDPVPDFIAPCSNGNSSFHFDFSAGTYVILCFFENTQLEQSRQILEFINTQAQPYLQTIKIRFFGVSTDSDDQEYDLIKNKPNGKYYYFWDFDKNISKRYQCISDNDTNFKHYTLILDPSFRVLDCFPHHDVQAHNERLMYHLQHMPEIDAHANTFLSAPILIVPRIFSHSFCQTLIQYFHENKTHESGFMKNKGEQTIYVTDDSFKMRRDCPIREEKLVRTFNHAIFTKLKPEILKAFQFEMTRIERYIVACYDSSSGGYFRQHRDNTTKGTAHRKFAVSINLNAEEFEGGDLRFPEFGRRTYRAPTGGAVVFSCSLLHECTSITRGTRYCTLPFLYDEAGAKLREENLKYVDQDSFKK